MTPTMTVYRTVTQAAAQKSQHSEQKKCQNNTPKTLTFTAWNKTDRKG